MQYIVEFQTNEGVKDTYYPTSLWGVEYCITKHYLYFDQKRGGVITVNRPDLKTIYENNGQIVWLWTDGTQFETLCVFLSEEAAEQYYNRMQNKLMKSMALSRYEQHLKKD